MILIKLFVLGFLLGTLGIQIIEGISTIIIMLSELVKAKISTSIAKCNIEIDSLDGCNNKMPAIGFATPTEEEGESND